MRKMYYEDAKENAAFERCSDAVSYTHLDVYKRQVYRPGEERIS